MKKKDIMIAFAGALVFAGCVTVETTKMQLESGNPQLVSAAEKIILEKGTSWEYSNDERINYINLTENQVLLAKIFHDIYYQDRNKIVAIATAKKLNFSRKGSIEDFLKNCLIPRAGIDREVANTLVESMLKTASVDELESVEKHLESSNDAAPWLSDPLAKKLAEESSNQELLFKLADKGRVAFDVVLKRLTDQKKLMSLCCKYHGADRAKVLEKIQDETICDFILNDPRYNDVYNCECGCKAKDLISRITDKKLLAQIKDRPGVMDGSAILNAEREQEKKKIAAELIKQMDSVCGFRFGSDLSQSEAVDLSKPFRRFDRAFLRAKDRKLHEIEIKFTCPDVMSVDDMKSELKATADVIAKKYGFSWDTANNEGFYSYYNAGVSVSAELRRSGLTHHWMTLTFRNDTVWEKAAKPKALSSDAGSDAL